jgi:endonuclease/exonuclease/phosphatase family metal-dependent hydrolase
MPRSKNDSGGLWIILSIALLLAIILILYSGRHIGGPVGHAVSPHDTTTTTIPIDGKTIKIASWNLQRFGLEKASDPALMGYYSEVIRGYDIVILQEITDASGGSFQKLCSMLPEYTCSVSSRLGNSSYKEQYGLLYKNAKLEGIAPGAGNYVRAPYTYRFSAGRWSFYLTTIHTDLDNVKSELSTLEKDLGSYDSADHIIMGDLNADCAYYHTPPADFISWRWAIPDAEDTTVKSSNCAYDRIILNKGAENNYISYGIMRNVSGEQSDHYLVYADYRTDAS